MTVKEKYERLLLDKIYKMIYNMIIAEAFDIYHPKQKFDIIIDEAFEPYKTEIYHNYWNDYKNGLCLWSDINSNCYFKLKESDK